MLEHTSPESTHSPQVCGAMPVSDPLKRGGNFQYQGSSSTKEGASFYAHAEAKRLLTKIGQGARIRRAPDKDVVVAVAFARGVPGLMLPAPDAAGPEEAMALLKYASMIEAADALQPPRSRITSTEAAGRTNS